MPISTYKGGKDDKEVSEWRGVERSCLLWFLFSKNLQMWRIFALRFETHTSWKDCWVTKRFAIAVFVWVLEGGRRRRRRLEMNEWMKQTIYWFNSFNHSSIKKENTSFLLSLTSDWSPGDTLRTLQTTRLRPARSTSSAEPRRRTFSAFPRSAAGERSLRSRVVALQGGLQRAWCAFSSHPEALWWRLKCLQRSDPLPCFRRDEGLYGSIQERKKKRNTIRWEK